MISTKDILKLKDQVNRMKGILGANVKKIVYTKKCAVLFVQYGKPVFLRIPTSKTKYKIQRDSDGNSYSVRLNTWEETNEKIIAGFIKFQLKRNDIRCCFSDTDSEKTSREARLISGGRYARRKLDKLA